MTPDLGCSNGSIWPLPFAAHKSVTELANSINRQQKHVRATKGEFVDS